MLSLMWMSPQEIKHRVEQTLPGSKVHVLDLTGTGDHFRVEVIAPQFEGRSLVEQHGMINGILAAPLADGSIHALSIKTASAVPGGASPAQGEKPT